MTLDQNKNSKDYLVLVVLTAVNFWPGGQYQTTKFPPIQQASDPNQKVVSCPMRVMPL